MTTDDMIRGPFLPGRAAAAAQKPKLHVMATDRDHSRRGGGGDHHTRARVDGDGRGGDAGSAREILDGIPW